jgi:hypothetical protein
METASPKHPATTPPYTLTHRCASEPDSTPEGARYLTALRVEGASKRALLQIVRRLDDFGGPIGLFGDVLSDAQAASIPRAIDSIEWASLPRPIGGERNAPVLTLEYALGTKIVRREFSSMAGEFITAIRPIHSIVDDLVVRLHAKPQRAIEVSAARTAGGFKLVWRNIGTGPVMLADPRETEVPGGRSKGFADVVAIPPPGKFAKSSIIVPLAASATPTHPVKLPPGGVLELETVPWAPPSPGEYAVSAAWVDYDGPKVNEKDVMPRIPKLDDLHDARPFVIRGGAFSTGVRFQVP